MRVRFTWQPKEWYEAVRLVTNPPRNRRDVPFMVYSILGITCLGGVGDLFHFLETRHIEQAGSLLLVGGAFTAAAGSGAIWLTRTGLRRRKAKHLPPMPSGEQEMVFKEMGWSAGTGASATTALQPWTTLSATRTGIRAMVMLGTAGEFTALPLRALSPDEAGYLKRLFARKIRTSPQAGPTSLATTVTGKGVRAYPVPPVATCPAESGV